MLRQLLAAVLFAGAAYARALPPTTFSSAQQASDGTQADALPKFTLIVSIDGLRHDYLAKIASSTSLQHRYPTFYSVIKNGTFAAHGAKSVLPSHTYPSHTSMITGANPDTHGVIGNSKRGKNAPSFQYTKDVLVPSVFTIAKQNPGITTASVSWPVSAGGPFDFNVPDAYGSDDAEWNDLYNNYVVGPVSRVLPTISEFKNMDDTKRTELAIDFIQGGANFLGIHLIELDHQEHLSGVFSDAAWAALDDIDVQLSQIISTAKKQGADFTKNSYLFLVSDHGFRNYTTTCSPATLFSSEFANLEIYSATGSYAFYPSNKNEEAEVDRVLAALPEECGVDKVFRGEEIKNTGGFPESYVVITAKDGYGFTASTSGALIRTIKVAGGHGYDPEESDLLASYVAVGPNVRKGARLSSQISLVDVGPTAGYVLGLGMTRFSGRVLTEIFV